MRFCQKRRVCVVLVFFIVFVTSVVNQIFAQQVININTDVNHNICCDSNISQNEVSSVSKNPVNNRVNINGGMANHGYANNNYIIINDGIINSPIVFDGQVDKTDTTTNNIVTITASKNVNISFICGAITPNSATNDVFTNNPLKIKTTGLTVIGISNIQSYDFYLPEDIKRAEVMITATGGGQKVYVSGDSPLPDTLSYALNLVNTNVNVYRDINYSLLNTGNKFVLIASAKGFTGNLSSSEFTLKQGFAFLCDCDIFLSSATLALTVKDMKFSQQTKSFSEGRAASVVFVNQASDIFADQGLVSAVKAVNLNSIDAVSFFGAASYGESKYKIGSNVTLKGSLLLGGLVKGIDLNCGRLISGVFCDYGNSNYDTFNNFEAFASVKGHGNNEYTGGGFLGRFDFKNNLYGELSGRMGNVQTDFYSLDIAGNYDDSLCLGWYAGLGRLCKFSDSLGLDTYGKYFFTRQKGKDVVLPANELIKFSDVDSRRFKLGTKLLYGVNSAFSFYGGGAYEYELDGTVNATIANITIDALCLKGGTSVYELGMTMNSGDFCIDLSLQKYIGLREGFTGMAKVSFAFLNYLDRFLGISIEKFEKEKTGRFGKVFTMSQKDCFNKSLKIIKELRARVTRKSLKKGYIIAFDFAKSFLDYCLDSTEVGIFIADEGSGRVKVEVISNNSLLAKDFSVKFFEMLEQK